MVKYHLTQYERTGRSTIENKAQEAPHTVDLRHYLAVIKTRKWTIGIVTLACLAATLFYSSRQTPYYTAEAQLLLQQTSTGFVLNAENEAATVTSRSVAQKVVEDLELEMSATELLGSASAAPQTATSTLILITYTSPDPVLARDIANSLAQNYIEFRRETEVEDVDSQRRALERQIESVHQKLAVVNRRLEEAREDGDDSLVATLQSQQSILTARLGVLEQNREDLRSTAAAENEIAEIPRPAVLPTSPSSPNHVRDAFLGLLLGLTLGVAAAFLRERLDDRFRGRPDVERALESPVLATVPRMEQTRGGTYSLAVMDDPRGAASEAYRNLRTGLHFISSQRGIKTLLLTSPSAHEGKTSTTANLGVAMAQTGRRVLLVSADLRRPQLERVFEAHSEIGLSSWLLGDEQDLRQLILEHPQIPNLYLMTSGPIPSNPAELLTSPRLPLLVSQLETTFDLVMFDSPPVLPVADSVILASHVGGVVLVVDAASTARSAAVHAKEQIERVEGVIIGCVLNAFDPGTTPYYYEPYAFSRYYDSADEGGSSRGEASRLQILSGERRSFPAERESR